MNGRHRSRIMMIPGTTSTALFLQSESDVGGGDEATALRPKSKLWESDFFIDSVFSLTIGTRLGCLARNMEASIGGRPVTSLGEADEALFVFETMFNCDLARGGGDWSCCLALGAEVGIFLISMRKMQVVMLLLFKIQRNEPLFLPHGEQLLRTSTTRIYVFKEGVQSFWDDHVRYGDEFDGTNICLPYLCRFRMVSVMRVMMTQNTKELKSLGRRRWEELRNGSRLLPTVFVLS